MSSVTLRVVPDTAVFVDVLRQRETAEALVAMRWRMALSSVVHSELLRGADSRTEGAYVADLARNHPPIAPTRRHWEDCGRILARLRRERDFDSAGLRRIQNDALIALTARELGCPVVTPDVADFELLAQFVGGLSVLPWRGAATA